MTQLLPLVDGLIRTLPAAVKQKLDEPPQVVADRAYDHDIYRKALVERGIGHRIARRNTLHGSGLGQWRWPVERTISWLHQFKRLRIRWERTAFMHKAFLDLACCVICCRTIRRLC